MVPKVAARGASFRGAARYYLHDKGAMTRERVGFSMTWNLPVEEPEAAWRWMAYTAMHAGVIKDEAGGARVGRKLEKPVYTLSLAWHPDEKPTTRQMVDAAASALKAVGLEKCQALLVAHNDEPHPHVHLIVNLVDPDTGKVRDPGLDRRKLSRWAEAYEREQGRILCTERVANNVRRDRGEIVVDRISLTRQDVEQRERIARDIRAQRWDDLWQRQLGDRAALKRFSEEQAARIRARIKQKYKPIWADHFRKCRMDEKAGRAAQQSLFAALRLAIKERRRLAPAGKAGLGTILAYAVDARALAATLEMDAQREAAAIRARLNDERRQLVALVWDDYGNDLRAMKDRQKDARHELSEQQKAEKAKAMREMAEEITRRRRARRRDRDPDRER